MKIKIRPDKASMPEESQWFQMDRWLAALRDYGHADPNRSPGNGYFPRGGGHTCPVSEIP
jgi:hypothetical protein